MKHALLSLALLLAAALAALGWVFWLPDVRPLKKHPPATTAYIELRRAQALRAGKRLDLRWTWVGDERISEHLKMAVITAEDDEFWRHDGVDWKALRAAWDKDRKAGRLQAGGSTITMQLARNLYLSPSKNPLRKAKEILIARRLERDLSKSRILELYLNTVEWGKGVFGCEAAAQTYFAKPCADLSPDESVAMAVVLPNPRRWDPAKRGAYVERNSRRILARMAASGWWSTELNDDGAATAILEGPQSGETTVNTSTGSVEGDQGKNPIAEE